MYALCQLDLNTKGLDILLNYPKDYKFDVIVFDISMDTCMYPLIDRFGAAPVVGVAPFLLPPALSYTFGNSMQSLYHPYYATLFSTDMSLKERFLNFVYYYYDVYYKEFVSIPRMYKLAQNKFGNDIRNFDDVERGIHILLSNTDPILNSPLALPPNVIPVGGLQCRPAKPLPKVRKAAFFTMSPSW